MRPARTNFEEAEWIHTGDGWIEWKHTKFPAVCIENNLPLARIIGKRLENQIRHEMATFIAASPLLFQACIAFMQATQDLTEKYPEIKEAFFKAQDALDTARGERKPQ